MHDTLSEWLAEFGKWCRMAREHSPPWVRLLLAGGVGAVLAVLLGWVDTHGEGIRIYLGAVGVVIASTVAFVGGRLMMDRQAERRTRRRRLNMAVMRVRRLAARLRHVREAVEHLSDRRSSGTADSSTAMTSDDVVDHYVRHLLDAAQAAGPAPSFDDIIDDEEGLEVAASVEEIFDRVRNYRDLADNTPDRQVRRRFAVLALLGRESQEALATQILRLDAAADHLAARSKAL